MKIENETLENLKKCLYLPELEADYRAQLKVICDIARKVAAVKTPIFGQFYADPLLGVYYKEPGDYLDKGEKKIPLHECSHARTVDFFQGGGLDKLALAGAARASQIETLTEMAKAFASGARV